MTNALYFDSYDDAVEELFKRQAAILPGILVKLIESPYGGFKVFNMPADVALDLTIDSVTSGTICNPSKIFK